MIVHENLRPKRKLITEYTIQNEKLTSHHCFVFSYVRDYCFQICYGDPDYKTMERLNHVIFTMGEKINFVTCMLMIIKGYERITMI